MGGISSMLKPRLPELPFEIIIEILSWLPVNSLLKFKCVCKQWCSLIQDYNFIEKHLGRSTTPLKLFYQFKYEPDRRTQVQVLDKNFKYISDYAGLLLEQSLSNSNVFRIRNPATHQVLYLPDTHDNTHRMKFVFNSATGECKVTYFCCFKHENGEDVGFQVITIGKDEQWRFVEAPSQYAGEVLKRSSFHLDSGEGAAHLVQTVRGQNSYLQVQSFDVLSECFTTSTLPSGVFLDLSKVHFLNWKGLLAVAEIVEEALNVLVLEDFKHQKWSNNKIIVPLKFLKEKPHLKDQIRAGDAGSYKNGVEYINFYDLKITGGWNYILSCSIKGEIVMEATSKKIGAKYSVALERPSLIALKGMKPENSCNQE